MQPFCWIVFVLLFVQTSCKVIQVTEREGEVCKFPDGTVGTCEELKGCRNDGGVIVRNNTVVLCSGFQISNIQVCCRKPFKIARKVCKVWFDYWRDNNGKCIFKNPLIVGGKEADEGQFPHIAIIGQKMKGKDPNWVCGGTLISQHFVLTAAHCVDYPDPYVVKFGEHDLNKVDDTPIRRITGPLPYGLYEYKSLDKDTRQSTTVEQTYRVREIIIYPEYNDTYHDIALLLLEEPVILTKRVLPACLPTDPKEDFVNKNVTIAGWGRLKHSQFKLSPTLQKVSIPVLDRLRCWESISSRNPRLLPKGLIKEQMCAGEDNKDSCQGDSGGPMVLQMKDEACEHVLAGVVSLGDGCGRLGVYTRVSSYIDWITGYIAPDMLP